MSFRLAVTYQPRGDQESAIAELTRGVREGGRVAVIEGEKVRAKFAKFAKKTNENR